MNSRSSSPVRRLFGKRLSLITRLTLAVACCSHVARAQYPASPQIGPDGTAVVLEDFATVPLSSRTTGSYPPAINLAGQLARVNFLRSEPSDAPLSSSRFFVNDLNRNLYILDKATRTFTTYVNFEEVFPKFDNDPGFAGGLVTFAFHPAYASNGRFYTVHTEITGAGSAVPTNGSLPGFNVSGYTNTAVFNPPSGSVSRQAVLIEWIDTNINDTTFQGTARELLRVGFNQVIHPMGDLIFNPLAQPGDEDYGNLYIANGDGASGETAGSTHTMPQRLDALQGKILRIIPDLNLHTNTSTLSSNRCYRIPTGGDDPNPFVLINLPNLKTEIYAYGFRNPHRMSWDPESNKLLVDDIGLHSWEEVNIIHKGSNYGYAEREGIEQLFVTSNATTNGKTGSQVGVLFPTNSDILTVTGLVSTVVPIYPVASYSHRDGNAVSSGFVYRGTQVPALSGKYIFGDIFNGRLFYSSYTEMLAADDGDRVSQATIRELQPVHQGLARSVMTIVAERFFQRGGTAPGSLPPAGRADIRLAQAGDRELYLLSKSDGMIRRLIATAIPPSLQATSPTNGLLTLSWPAISNRVYRVEFASSLSETNWSALPGDITATNANASTTDLLSETERFYRLLLLP